MKSRLAASVALSALVIVGATGCSMISPQATTIQYSASDGVNVKGDGPVVVRNAFVVADEEGETGNLVAGLVNVSTQDATLSIQVDGSETATIRLRAGETISLGGEDSPLRLDGIATKPGATLPVYFQSGDTEGELASVPVLDGTLPYYADLVPSAKPTTTPAPTPSAPATPAPAETPNPDETPES
ncbi:DNA modification methylase [Microbacterium resistens]|uniref:DNA modification methylase n=1 Tax=Microbacterium resistens TaxID=156977 RepID=A0ABY3RR95_9MICO|nr:DNA modification methylase [Microbacterium resistens]UGS26638.1 DNA modification methylase [Microbacterium resistens]